VCVSVRVCMCMCVCLSVSVYVHVCLCLCLSLSPSSIFITIVVICLLVFILRVVVVVVSLFSVLFGGFCESGVVVHLRAVFLHRDTNARISLTVPSSLHLFLVFFFLSFVSCLVFPLLCARMSFTYIIDLSFLNFLFVVTCCCF
jgi:membrane-bound ClpP family serine protease